MKTNHRRGFKDARHPRAVFRRYIAAAPHDVGALSGHAVAAWATAGDHANGKRGIARDVAGAKKFVRSRIRFHENAAVRGLLRDPGLLAGYEGGPVDGPGDDPAAEPR